MIKSSSPLDLARSRSSAHSRGSFGSRSQLLFRMVGFVVLLSLGVALRWHFASWPNFSPVAGLAMAGGLLFRHRLLAVSLPLLTMLVSDWVLGGYDLPVMICVYGCLLLAGWMGDQFGRSSWSPGHGSTPLVISRSAVAGVGMGVVSATLFFLVTNAAYWAFMTRGAGSLADAYLAGLPFFRSTLTSDILFGSCGMAVVAGLLQAQRARSGAEAPVSEPVEAAVNETA